MVLLTDVYVKVRLKQTKTGEIEVSAWPTGLPGRSVVVPQYAEERGLSVLRWRCVVLSFG